MTDRDSFVAAIAANPDDDTPRLAFADWLEENGDAARAGFVRDQVRLARLPAGTEEYRELFKKAGATLRANLPAWIQDACDAFGQPAVWTPLGSHASGLMIGFGKGKSPEYFMSEGALVDGTFVRGFLDRVGLLVGHLKDAAALNRLLREHPITRFTLFSQVSRIPDSMAAPLLDSVRNLTIRGCLFEESAGTLFKTWKWKSLRYLSLEDHRYCPVPELCRSPLAKQLQGLKLPIASEYLRALAAYPLDDSLKELHLSPAEIHEEFVRNRKRILTQLSALPFRPTLKKLGLAGCYLQDAGLAAFARGEVWIRLRALALDRNRFGDPGWRDFARGRRTPELRVLTASRNFLTNDGAVRLGESSLVETLEYVDLRGNRIEGKGAMALARHFADSPLKKLLLDGNPIREADAKAVRKVLGGRVDIG